MNPYLPRPPARIPLCRIPGFLLRHCWDNATRFCQLFVPFDATGRPALKDLPLAGLLSDAQRNQAKEIFDLSETRLAGLSERSSTLLSTVGMIAPLEVAAVALVWGRASEVSPLIYAMFVASLGLLVLAAWAVVRASNLVTISWPGVEAIVDTSTGQIRAYDQHRDAMCLLWCALANNVVADRRFDFVRTGTSLVVLSLLTLVAGGTMLLPVSLNDDSELSAITQRVAALEDRALSDTDQLSKLRVDLDRLAASVRDAASSVQRSQEAISLHSSDVSLHRNPGEARQVTRPATPKGSKGAPARRGSK